jgi:hypothetical protein
VGLYLRAYELWCGLALWIAAAVNAREKSIGPVCPFAGHPALQSAQDAGGVRRGREHRAGAVGPGPTDRLPHRLRCRVPRFVSQKVTAAHGCRTRRVRPAAQQLTRHVGFFSSWCIDPSACSSVLSPTQAPSSSCWRTLRGRRCCSAMPRPRHLGTTSRSRVRGRRGQYGRRVCCKNEGIIPLSLRRLVAGRWPLSVLLAALRDLRPLLRARPLRRYHPQCARVAR